jgi:colanic acid/amylovoran biosynthesis glycosyltransferase
MRPLTVDICGYDKLEVAGGPIVWLMRFPGMLREYGINVRVRLMTWDAPDRGVALQTLKKNGFDVVCQRFANTESNIRWHLYNLRDSPPDVFIPNLVTPALYAARWAKSAGIPTVGVLHSDDRFYSGVQQEFVLGRSEFALSSIVCVSEELERQVIGNGRATTVPVRIPYGVSIPDGKAKKIPGRLRIGFVGRLAEEQKRISDVVRAFCRLTQQSERIEAVIYGDGPDRQNVVNILASEDWPERVTLAGLVPSHQIQQRLIEECDTIVLLSDYEGLPIALLEAMACGVVPVCLNMRSGIPELVKNGHTGLIVSDRGEDFMAAIYLLRDNDDLWQRLSTAARYLVAAEYSHKESSRRWASLIHSLAEKRTLPSPISIPAHFDLPPVNSALANEDVRAETKKRLGITRRAIKFVGRLKRTVLRACGKK